jgi:hypothetical protein
LLMRSALPHLFDVLPMLVYHIKMKWKRVLSEFEDGRLESLARTPAGVAAPSVWKGQKTAQQKQIISRHKGKHFGNKTARRCVIGPAAIN